MVNRAADTQDGAPLSDVTYKRLARSRVGSPALFTGK